MRTREGKWLIPDLIAQDCGKIQDPYPIDPVHLCIEILSPGDSLKRTIAKCEEYHAWGVPFCWVIDPVRRTAWEYHSGGEPQRALGALRAGEMVVSLDELFSVIDL